jgi:DNA-binding transcriptional MerR regulator
LFDIEQLEGNYDPMAPVVEPQLRMRDVCARTGLARSTIHHYIREGLLPKPHKTGRNTALYDEGFVRRAQLIKTLQQKTHLPLAAIRETLEGTPSVATVDPDRFVNVTRTIADELRLASERATPRKELLATTGLRPAELDGMALVGLVEPDGDLYPPVEVRIVHALLRLRDAGATPERGFVGSPSLLKAYRTHMRMLKPLAEIDLDPFVDRMLEPLGDLISALHRKALVHAVTELTQNGGERGST